MNIWPDWTDTEEPKARGGRGAPAIFEDLESFELPAGLANVCEQWKRPSELFLAEEGKEEPPTPVIVEAETSPLLDLVTANLHLFPLSELIRWIVCQLHALWQQRDLILVSPTNPGAEHVQWRPWDHIFPQNKGSPMLSPNSKYTVRLFWMNSWKRITIDDSMPVDVDGRLLLPCSSNPCELWPALLSKAILKVASLDYNSPSARGDFGEASVVHLLTGWCPQKFNTSDLKNKDQLWPLFLRALPLWKPSSEKRPKSPALSPDKQEAYGLDSNSSRASMKGKPPAKGSAKADTKKGGSRMGGAGKKPTVDGSDKEQLEQLERFSKLNPGGEPEHPTTCLLFATFKSSSECVGAFEVKKNKETLDFMKGNQIPPDQAHPLQLMEVRDRALKPPDTPPPYPPKKFPRYPGHRHRRENPFDDRLPPLTPPKEPRFIRLQSVLAGTWDPPEKEVVNQPLLVSLLEKMKKSARSKDRVGKRLSIDISSITEGTETPSEEIDMWIEFEDFLRLFTNFFIFYRPNVFPYDEKFEKLSPQVMKGGTRAASGTASRNVLSSHKSAVLNQYSFDSVSDAKLLYVDSSRPIHILISLSSFVNWKLRSQGSLVFQKNTRVILRSTTTSSTRSTESVHKSHRTGPLFIDKQEVLETKEAWLRIVPYDWRALGECRPHHIIQTSAVNSYLLSLPPGRYVYKLLTHSPIGMVLTIQSHTKFRVVEEEDLLSLLTGTPAAFKALSKKMFDHIFEVALPKLRNVEEFSRVLQSGDLSPIQGHYSEMCQSLFDSMTSKKEQMCLISSKYLLCKIFLLKTFKTLDPNLKIDTCRSYKTLSETDRPDVSRFSEEDILKISKLQFYYRVHRKSRDRLLYTSGSKENDEFSSDLIEVFSSLKEDFLNAWENKLYQICEEFTQHRAMLRLDGPHEMKIYTQTYEGVTDLDNEKWALLFRDTFQLSQPNFLSYLLFTKGGAKARLRLINNDTGEEMQAVSGKLLPRRYLPSELGYTLLGEGEVLCSNGEIDATGDLQWKLVVVGSQDKLPTLKSGKPIQCQFNKLREKEAYLPDRNYVMFRYMLSSNVDTHLTLQLTTSKPEAIFRVVVEQGGELTREVEAKGTCLIPSLLIRAPEGDEKREYSVWCEVLRKSWTHQDSAWVHINEIRSLTVQTELTPTDSKKKETKKSSVMAKRKPPGKNTCSTVSLDGFPHWVLRLVSPDELKLSKDTRRVDEIKTMKEGWEEQEEGRAEKAKLTRKNFVLNKSRQDSEEGSVPDLDALHSETSLANPILPVATSLELPQTDFSSYTVTNSEESRLLDASEEERREGAQRLKNQLYKAWRQDVIKRRDSEIKLRNNFKAKQLATIENLIKISDEFHERILQPREKIRQASLKVDKSREEVESPGQGKEAKKDKKEKSPPKGKPRK